MPRKRTPLVFPAEVLKYRSRDEWEKTRNSDPERIGASDVANLWGVGYGSPLSLWREILRRRDGLPEEPISEGLAARFEIGHYLEPYVRELAAREIEGYQVLSPEQAGLGHHRILPDDDPLSLHPAITRHVAVTLDAVAYHKGSGIVPVELKTVDPGAVSGWPEDRPHPAAALQAATQAVVLRSGFAYVYAMVGYGTGERSRRLYRVEVPRGFADELGRRLLEFFRSVEVREPPEPTPKDTETISKMFPAAIPGKTIYLPAELAKAAIQREEWKRQVSVLEDKIGDADAKLKLAMQDAETGIITGTDVAVAYPTITRVEKPRLEPKVTTYRRLSIRQATKQDYQRALGPGEEEHG